MIPKHRCWIIAEKRMATVESIFELTSEKFAIATNNPDFDLSEEITETNPPLIVYEYHEFILMQSTYQDKQYFFEADRVEVSIANGRIEYGTIGIADGCFEILFDNEIFDFGKYRDYLKCYTCNHAVKVVGYANPELLGDKK